MNLGACALALARRNNGRPVGSALSERGPLRGHALWVCIMPTLPAHHRHRGSRITVNRERASARWRAGLKQTEIAIANIAASLVIHLANCDRHRQRADRDIYNFSSREHILPLARDLTTFSFPISNGAPETFSTNRGLTEQKVKLEAGSFRKNQNTTMDSPELAMLNAGPAVTGAPTVICPRRNRTQPY